MKKLENAQEKVNDEHRPQRRSFSKEVIFRLPRFKFTSGWEVVVTNKHQDRLRKELDEYRQKNLKTELQQCRQNILEQFELQQYRQKILEQFELERAISVALLLQPLSLPVLAIDKIYRFTKSAFVVHVPFQEACHLFATIKQN